MARLGVLIILVATGCGGSDESAATPDAGDASLPDASADLDAAATDAAGEDSGGAPEPGPPPDWNPDFDLDGTGWRDSTEPLCNPYAGNHYERGIDVWADDRGVFVLETIVNDPFMLAPPYPDGSVLHFNDGAGWTTWYDSPVEPGTGGAWLLTGVPDGPLFTWPGACPVRRIDGPDETTCVYAEEPPVYAVHMVTATSGWLAIGDGPAWIADGVVEWLGTLEAGEYPRGIWGDEDQAILVTTGGVYRVDRTSGMTTLRVNDSTSWYSSLWARSFDDLWIGTDSGAILHFVDGAWASMPTGTAGPIFDLWSDGTTLYFVTYAEFGRWSASTGVELLIELDEGTALIEAIGGDPDTGEVYIAFVDGEFSDYLCGPGMLVWFDGERFRRF